MDLNFNEAHDKSDASKSQTNPVINVLREYGVYFFTPESEVIRPEAIVRVDDAELGSEGNSLIIVGLPKAGKSALMQAILAGMITASDADTLGFTVKKNIQRKAIIYVDTELSKFDFLKGVNSILKRAGLSKDQTPDYFYAISLRGKSIKQRKEILERVCEEANKHHDGIFCIGVDGIADFVTSVNNEEEGNAVIDLVSALSDKYNSLVISAVHLNPSVLGRGSKPRGHLGSQLERKAESMIYVKKVDEGISVIYPGVLRNASGFKPIHFRYDKEKEYHVLDHLMEMGKEQVQKHEDKQMLDILFQEDVEVESEVMRERYAKHTGNKLKSAYPVIAGLEQRAVIKRKDGSKLYVKAEL